MKKSINMSFFYGMLGIFSGAFYREFTKFLKFTGKTRLSLIHGHVLGLGMLFFLIVSLLEKNLQLSEDSKYQSFFKLYNVSLIGVIISFYVKGLSEVLSGGLVGKNLAIVDGISGIIHILLTYSLYLFFTILRRRALDKTN